jgi:peptidoglycan/xylan/chitin deacetylase (PgdA/CDA1 family)
MVLLDRPRAVVHVDLDGGRHIYRIRGWHYAEAADPLFESGVAAALDFFDRHGVRATFFAIAEDLLDPRKRVLLEHIVERGHEIGSHSSTHRRLTTLPDEDHRREVIESRHLLQDALGIPVEGFRAPAFDSSPLTLSAVAEAGYRYDSSLRIGDRRAARCLGRSIDPAPFQITPGSPSLEIPLPPTGWLPLPFHPSYSLILGHRYFLLGLTQAIGRVPVFVLLFHLTDFSAPLDDNLLRPPMSRLFTLSHLSSEAKRERCRRMLDAVRGEYAVVPTRSVIGSVNAAHGGSHESVIQ